MHQGSGETPQSPLNDPPVAAQTSRAIPNLDHPSQLVADLFPGIKEKTCKTIDDMRNSLEQKQKLMLDKKIHFQGAQAEVSTAPPLPILPYSRHAC
jgi:hypothetical protein